MCTECNERRYSRGLCRRHYQRWYARKFGNPDIARPDADDPPRLQVDNRGRQCEYCQEPALSRGLCRRHYKRLWRRGLLRVKLT